MKDSGIPWLGQIPEQWETKRLGLLYTQRNEKVSDKDFPPLSVTMKGILPQLETAAKTNDGDNRKLVRKGDFAINSRSDRRGSCGISSLDGSVSLINTVLFPHEDMSASYYNWLFHTSLFADEFYRWGHGIVDDLWTTRWSEMKNIHVPYLSLPEQERIAEYLDGKCAEIDELIGVEEQMIAELQAYKQSIITETVTRGLNPAAPLKDSGIPWLGQIPEEWEVKMLSSVAKEHYISNENVHHQNLLSLSYGKIVKKDIGTREGLLPASFDTYQIVEKGNIVLRLTDLQNDQKSLRVGLSLQEGIITSAYLALEVRQKTDYCYLYYLLHTIDTNKVLYGMGSGVRQSLKWQELKQLPLPLPPLPEQKAIAEYLDKKCAEIDALVEVKRRKTEELKEYKKSVIYEYVTGKREIV